MKCRLIAAGTRLPDWVNSGFHEYQKRLRAPLVPRAARDSGCDSPRRARTRDARYSAKGRDMLAALGQDDYVVALEIAGKSMSTEQLSAWLAVRMREGRPLALLIGGPDGLAPPVSRAGRSELVAVAADPAACPGPGGGGRTALPCHEPSGRPPLSPRLGAVFSAGHGECSDRLPFRYPDDMSLDFIYLASGSPRRRELLQQIGVSFRLVGAAVDETALAGESPPAYVARLRPPRPMPAGSGCRDAQQAPVLAADTAVILDGRILGKPADRCDAEDMLRAAVRAARTRC